MWQTLKANIKHLPSTLLGLALLLAALPQEEAVQKLMTISPKLANTITTTACVAGGIASIILLGQKVLSEVTTTETNKVTKETSKITS
jgi:hypothetical protein